MQTQRVQKALQDIHHQEDSECDARKDSETNVGCEPIHVQGRQHGLFPKDGCQLRVGERQSPKT